MWPFSSTYVSDILTINAYDANVWRSGKFCVNNDDDDNDRRTNPTICARGGIYGLFILSTGMEMANLNRLLALTLPRAQGDHLWY